MSTIGFKVDDQVRTEILDANVLIADITYPNSNVFYEMGYAIARGKPFIPTVNVAVERAKQRIVEIGLFDTIGWAGYANADELLAHLIHRVPVAAKHHDSATSMATASPGWLDRISDPIWEASGVAGRKVVRGTPPRIQVGLGIRTVVTKDWNRAASGQLAAKASRTRVAVSQTRTAIFSIRARMEQKSPTAKG